MTDIKNDVNEDGDKIDIAFETYNLTG